jgi:hypothetical protein
LLEKRASSDIILSANRDPQKFERGYAGEKTMRTTGPRIVAIAFATSFWFGCSSTTTPLVSEWHNPGYHSASFKRIMVGGMGGTISIQRNFEDEFVTQLRAAGVDALPSYRFLPDAEQTDEAKIKEAAQKADADGVILVKSIRVEEKQEYRSSYFPASWFGIAGANVGASWSGPGGAPSVYHYTEYTSETTLYDLGKNDVVWAATVTTTEPSDVKAGIKTYAETVLRALRDKNLLAKRE